MLIKKIPTIMGFLMAPLVALAAPPSNDAGNMTMIADLEPADTAGTLQGLNCKGSRMCKDCSNLDIVIRYVKDIPDIDNQLFGDHFFLACGACNKGLTGMEALCVFPQKLKKGDYVSGKVVLEKLQVLKNKGCTKCGSAPFHGNDVSKGMITVNFVREGCPDGWCPLAGKWKFKG